MKPSYVNNVYATAQEAGKRMSENLSLFLESKGCGVPHELEELDRLQFNQMRDDRDAIFHHLAEIEQSISLLADRLNIPKE